MSKVTSMRANAPGAHCPARMGKVKLRNTRWREISTPVFDADGQWAGLTWHSEPLIVMHPARRLPRELPWKRTYSYNEPKWSLDEMALVLGK